MSGLRVGIVCPYSLDVHGGVQAHVVGLASALERAGHTVSVLAPAGQQTAVPPFVTSAGRAMGVPYNGSVARVAFGPLSYARTRRWLQSHEFDVLHLHEPTTVSLSVLALLAAQGPIVVTFHTSTERSRALRAFGGVLRPLLEKVTARIAVSPTARQVQVRHLGGDAVEIPNGVDVGLYAGARPDVAASGGAASGGVASGGAAFGGVASGGAASGESQSVVFVGRYDEPRKGMGVLLAAMRTLAPARPGLRLTVVGSGAADELRRAAGPLAERLDVLGPVDDMAKAAALRAATVFCAPNLHGESFGIVLVEAMAAGAPVVASDIDGFRAVLGTRRGPTSPAGVLVPPGDAAALAGALDALLADDVRRVGLVAAGTRRAADFDWPVVARAVERVYRAAVAADPLRGVRVS